MAKTIQCPLCNGTGAYEPKSAPVITAKILKSMALNVVTRAFYDKADREAGVIPVFEYPEVEKALRKWFKRLGIEIKED